MALILIGGYLLWPIPSLVLVQRETGEVVYRQNTPVGQKFVFRFRHSYDQGWVEEIFRVRDQRSFVLSAHRFQVVSYDARDQTYPGDFSIDEDGFARVSNIEKYQEVIFTHLLIRVAYTVPQFIETKGSSIALGELAPRGSLLLLKIVPASRIWGIYHLQL